jgi:hypothetical protein
MFYIKMFDNLIDPPLLPELQNRREETGGGEVYTVHFNHSKCGLRMEVERKGGI